MDVNMQSRKEKSNRFTSILSSCESDRSFYNKPIFSTEDYVVVPSLGSIVPGWLLVIPRRFSINFRHWSNDSGKDPAELVHEVLSVLGGDIEETIWFEHGASNSGSSIGCGVDYAHIHMIINPNIHWEPMIAGIRDEGIWTNVDSPFKNANRYSKEYYFISHGENCLINENVINSESQYFRKKISAHVQMDSLWNYKQHQFLDNCAKTIDRFSFR